MDLHQFLLIKFQGFGSRKEFKILWQFSIFAILWCIWLERNARSFNDSFSTIGFVWYRITIGFVWYRITIGFVWDRITFLASLSCLAHGLFDSIPLVDIQRDWHALLHGLSL